MVVSENSPHGQLRYNSGNHLHVVFRCMGSTWPRVLPFCIANVFLMMGLSQLAFIKELQLGITTQAHTFGGIVVSFLVVSRINTAIARYSECVGYIAIMFRESRGLIQNMLVFSRKQKNTSIESRNWRIEVAYRTLMLLRTSVAMVEYPSVSVAPWEVPELTGQELEYCTPPDSWRRHDQKPHTKYTDCLRVPLLMAYLLRQSIASQDERLPNPIPILLEIKLLGSIDSFLQGYTGMRKLMTTPVPFPLIQMTRTMVLLYVFTLPLVFVTGHDTLFENCAAVFLLTYGFMGLELVSIELDDPFGDDANDFDVLAAAQTVFEDTFLMIHDADGEAWADTLRYKMQQKVDAPLSPTELTALMNTSLL